MIVLQDESYLSKINLSSCLTIVKYPSMNNYEFLIIFGKSLC